MSIYIVSSLDFRVKCGRMGNVPIKGATPHSTRTHDFPTKPDIVSTGDHPDKARILLYEHRSYFATPDSRVCRVYPRLLCPRPARPSCPRPAPRLPSALVSSVILAVSSAGCFCAPLLCAFPPEAVLRNPPPCGILSSLHKKEAPAHEKQTTRA